MELLRLRGLVDHSAHPTTALDVLAVVRAPAVIATMHPKQDRFLAAEPGPLYADAVREGRALIAVENQAIWFADVATEAIDADTPTGADDVAVRVFDPEIGIEYGELPLEDFLVRMIVQEVVFAMRPRRWDRRRMVSASIDDDATVAAAPELLGAVDGPFPLNVAVGPDWIVEFGRGADWVYLLQYEAAGPTLDERFERARVALSASWA